MASADGTKKRKVCHNTQLMTLSIPNDIIVEILSWVPADSLLRFRWACKYWFDLIARDPDFIKLHLHCSTSTNSHNPSVLITNPLYKQHVSHNLLEYYYIDSNTGFFSLRVRINDDPIIFGTCVDFVHFRILGSCHGLLLFSYSPTRFPCQPKETRYCIWNPCTKEYKKIPNCVSFYSTYTFGFGYDRGIDDYKVIRNEYIYNGIDNYHYVSSHVYTLGRNSWRDIEYKPGNLFPRSWNWGNAVFVNGALYWIDYSDTKIISFDFEKEIYEEISNQPVECCFPNDWDPKARSKLEMFEGSLCLMLYTDNYIEMWVMDKKIGSWSKIFKILLSFHNILKPLRFTKKGEILLLDSGRGLFLCDPKDNTTTTMTFYRTGEGEGEGEDEDADADEGEDEDEDEDEYEDESEGEGADEDDYDWSDHNEAVYIESLVSLNSGTYTVEEEPNY